MINIEIHGVKGPADVAEEIFEITKDLPYSKEIVCTGVPSFCIDRNLVQQPFLRIRILASNQIDALVKRLKALGKYNIEVTTLLELHPATNQPSL